MKKLIWLAFASLPFFGNVFAHSLDTRATKTLEEVVITSSRIDLPLSKNDRSIVVISKEMIQETAAPTVVDLLQQVAGVDVRRRGISGMQADLFIRGGSFDQTLLLIDGIKLDDAQTGHHILNFALPVEVIERIEIIKGPAARVFGLNAFTGAVNIVTQSGASAKSSLGMQTGSYGQLGAELTLAGNTKENQFLAHLSTQNAEGYRYNTDFKTTNALIKADLKANSNFPITLFASFSDRKFGANGFYASPSYVDQYEETQAGLLSIASKINLNQWVVKPRVYWRRGQDEYIFVRNNPAIYRNLHLTHKVGTAIDASYYRANSTTGIGVDLARVSISSNNLGDRSRFVTTVFAEHQMRLANEKLTLTPGIAATHYTDFGVQFFPGIDFGYALNQNLRLFGNVGYTYRIPTFTDLYYSDPTTLGNENLEEEEALTEEVGLRYFNGGFEWSVALFNRDAKNLIDYIRTAENEQFQATNIREVTTQGIELTGSRTFRIAGQAQRFQLGYSYLNDTIDDLDRALSRYSINTMRHHFTANYTAKIVKNITASVMYKWAQRPAQEAYQVVDASVQWQLHDLRFSFYANNLFNEVYTESSLVPMPLGNGLFRVQVVF